MIKISAYLSKRGWFYAADGVKCELCGRPYGKVFKGGSLAPNKRPYAAGDARDDVITVCAKCLHYLPSDFEGATGG